MYSSPTKINKLNFFQKISSTEILSPRVFHMRMRNTAILKRSTKCLQNVYTLKKTIVLCQSISPYYMYVVYAFSYPATYQVSVVICTYTV